MNIIPVLAGTGFALAGVFMGKHALNNYQRAVASKDWLTVQGALSEVRLWGKRNIDGQMVDAKHLSVKYTYQVDSEKYTGSAATFYTLVYPETTEIAEKFSQSDSVTVYYNPAKPDESVLLPGSKTDKPFSEFYIAAIALVLGTSIAIMAVMGVIG